MSNPQWHRTPWWLRLIGKPAWRIEGFGGVWFYASKPWAWSDALVHSQRVLARSPASPGREGLTFGVWAPDRTTVN